MFDVGKSIIKGSRDYQDDNYFINDPYGKDTALTKLHSLLLCIADGVGGEAAGNVASKIVCRTSIETIVESLKKESVIANIPELLRNVLPIIQTNFNEMLAHNETYKGMATTMLLCFLECNHLYWLSIGDSRLILFRNGKIRPLNDDHSYGMMLDRKAAKGEMSFEEAASHPERHYLVSYVGGGEINSIDAPTEPTELRMNDILLLATDGVNSLSDDEIKGIVHAPVEAQTIAYELTDAIARKDIDYQDNTTVIVVKMTN